MLKLKVKTSKPYRSMTRMAKKGGEHSGRAMIILVVSLILVSGEKYLFVAVLCLDSSFFLRLI